MDLGEIIKLIEMHMELNCASARDYKEMGNDELCLAHISGVTALKMLKNELVEEYEYEE